MENPLPAEPPQTPDDPEELAALLRASVDGFGDQVDPLIDHWATIRAEARPQTPEQWRGVAYLDRKLGVHHGVDLDVLASAVAAAEKGDDDLELLRTRVSYALARAAAGDELGLEEGRYLVERIATRGTAAEAASAWMRLARAELEEARQAELLEGAAGLYQRARDPEWATIALMEAAAVRAENDPVDAMVLLGRAEALCPPGMPILRAGLHETRGQLAGLRGDFDETREQWEQALALADGVNPRYVMALRLRMCPLYQGFGDLEAFARTVVRLIDDAVAAGDDQTRTAAVDQAEVVVAELYALLGDPDAVPADSGFDDAQHVATLLAGLLDRLGQPDEADAVLRRHTAG